jgi:hypothetical protein
MRALQDIIEYDVEVKYLLGAKNYVQDALSPTARLPGTPLPRATTSRREEAARKRAEKVSRTTEVAGEVTEVVGAVAEGLGEGLGDSSGESSGEGLGDGASVGLGGFGVIEATHGELFTLVV